MCPRRAGHRLTSRNSKPGQSSHRFPHFLPGGRQFLFCAQGTSPGLYLGSLDSPESKRLAAATSGALFVPPNWLLFVRQGTLLAQRFDLARGELTGEPVSVADQVAFNPSFSVWRIFGLSRPGRSLIAPATPP